MFILFFLLSILSIPIVLLKPIATNSELVSKIKVDESGSKLQTAFFDLLRQTIEKYCNCAGEHLAPLRELADHKQHESLTYPERLSQQSPPVAGFTSPSHNNSNIICTKINLCSIQNRQSHAAPGYESNSAVLEKSLDTTIDKTKHHLAPYFPPNLNDKTMTPIFTSNLYGLRNIPPKFSSKYSDRNNFTYISVNHAIFNRFLYGSINANRSPHFANTNPSHKMNICPCLGGSATNHGYNNEKEMRQIVNRTTSDIILANKHDIKLFSEKTSKRNQNLNLLFQQLDEIAQNVDNEDLKEILEKLKAMKPVFEINSSNKEFTSTDPSIATTTSPTDEDTSTFKAETNPPSYENNENITHLAKSLNDTNSKETKSSVESKEIVVNEGNIYQSPSNVNSAFFDLSDANSTLNTPKSNNTNSQDHLQKDEKTINLVSSMADTNSEPNHAKLRDVNAEIVDEKINVAATNSNNSISLNSPIPSKNDSGFQISMTSFNNFQNIQVEQQLSTDKNIKINAQENMKNAPSFKNGSEDMMGTGSTYVNVFKQPHKKIGRYAEPILYEICSGKSKFKTKPPLSVYWHKIEDKPLKLKRIPSDVWKTFQSLGIDETERSSEENLSRVLRGEIHCEDNPHSKECESEQINL